jgi:putative ABC transport system permease protein
MMGGGRMKFWQFRSRRQAREADLERELRRHLDLEAEEQPDAGLSAEEAEYAARRTLGNTVKIKEDVRIAWGFQWLETLLQDLRYGLRQLRRNPGFTSVVVLTLALGIGANTAIFSLANGVLLRSLPYFQPHQLYMINEDVPQLTAQSPWGSYFPVNAGNFLQWQAQCPAISAMALIGPATMNLTGAGIPRQLLGLKVSAGFFPMMGIRPLLGRTFAPEEDQQGRDHEVMLTAQFWHRVFSSDPKIIGKLITLDHSPHTVVGILREDFHFPELPLLQQMLTGSPDFFKPIWFSQGDLQPGIGGFNYLTIARLKPGASPQEALAQLNVVESRIAQKGDASRHVAPGQFDLRALIRPLKTAIVGPAQQALWMLVAAAGFVLLIICVNLASLMMARNAARAREISVRSALGATARRLVRQFFAEGLILAAGGGILGVLFAAGGIRFLIRNAPVGIPRVDDVRIDSGVLLFTAGVSMITALLFGLFPALRLAAVRPVEALKSAGRAAGGTLHDTRLRSALVAAQIALSGILLTGSLLLIRSLLHVTGANQWMDDQHVLAADLAIPPSESHSVEQANEFLSRVLEQVRMLAGVRNAAFTSKLPLLGQSFGDDIDFREAPEPRDKPQLGDYRFVSPGYFEAIGLRLLKGRLLSESDRGKNVALISETVARKFLSGRDPIGMHLMWGEGSPEPREIVGEVSDVRNAPDQPPIPAVYLPLWTFYQTSETLVVRTFMDPSAAADSVRRAVWRVDPEVAIPRERTLKTIVQSSEASRRYVTILGSMFAMFAALLAALGLYGVISYSVSRRAHEIGIRMALGARKNEVLKTVISQGLRLAVVGVAVGLMGALALTRFLSSLLYGVKPNDPLTFAVAPLILVSAAFVASYIPARRATKVDPMIALRWE